MKLRATQTSALSFTHLLCIIQDELFSGHLNGFHDVFTLHKETLCPVIAISFPAAPFPDPAVYFLSLYICIFQAFHMSESYNMWFLCMPVFTL